MARLSSFLRIGILGIFAPLAQGSFGRVKVSLSRTELQGPLTPADAVYLGGLEKKCMEVFERARRQAKQPQTWNAVKRSETVGHELDDF